MSENNYEPRFNKDGTNNPKYVDLLEEDKPIAGQKFCCVSFVSPEKILKQKELYFFEKFLNNWEFSKSTQKYQQFLNFLSYKYGINFDDLMKDFEEFNKDQLTLLKETTISDDYKTYLDHHEEELENDFSVENSFQTHTRGIKVRGTFPTQEEAELRCKMLRELDPSHDVFVGPVGLWMPWDPESYKTGRVEHLEEELNELMHEKKKNEAKAKEEFDKRVKEAKQKAIEENKKIAAESGNKLTQNITEDGQLVNVKDMNTMENKFNNKQEVSVADIRKELFEGDNVVMSKDTDHGLSNLKLNGSEEEKCEPSEKETDVVNEVESPTKLAEQNSDKDVAPELVNETKPKRKNHRGRKLPFGKNK
jgi:hypothetical protein